MSSPYWNFVTSNDNSNSNLVPWKLQGQSSMFTFCLVLGCNFWSVWCQKSKAGSPSEKKTTEVALLPEKKSTKKRSRKSFRISQPDRFSTRLYFLFTFSKPNNNHPTLIPLDIESPTKAERPTTNDFLQRSLYSPIKHNILLKLSISIFSISLFPHSLKKPWSVETFPSRKSPSTRPRLSLIPRYKQQGIELTRMRTIAG